MWFDASTFSHRSSTFRWISRTALKDSADGLAELVGYIAHELMHIVWRTDFDYRAGKEGGWIPQYLANTHGHSHDWGKECDGEPLGVSHLRLYRFEHSSERELASQRSKHWFTRLFQEFLHGMLVHDLEGVFASRRSRWWSSGGHCDGHVWP